MTWSNILVLRKSAGVRKFQYSVLMMYYYLRSVVSTMMCQRNPFWAQKHDAPLSWIRYAL